MNTHAEKIKTLIIRLAGALIMGATLACATTAAGQPATTPLVSAGLHEDGTLRLIPGKGALLTTRVPYKRVSVGQPDIADVNPVGPTSVLVSAKKAGVTQVIVWDENEVSQVIDVTVIGDFAALQAALTQLFPGNKIEVSGSNGTVILRGHVTNAQISEQVVSVATPYASKVLNFLEIAGGQQVMLQVRFAEVSKTATSQLGINFAGTDGVSVFGSNIGGVNPFGLLAGAGVLGDTAIGSGVQLFGKGAVGSVQFQYFINALRSNNLMRVLAEPNLTAISGEEASFLAGGEYPVPVSQGGGTASSGAAVTVEYREFGVKLKFIPIVLGDGRIRLKVTPEVSDLDYANGVRSNGFIIPALSKRTVSTTIELTEGQSFAIAGLLNNRTFASKDVTPLLGDVPVLGALFRSVKYQRQETELVVLVTPRLVEAMNPEQVPGLPGEKWKHPTENDLFWNQDLGGPQPDFERAPLTTAGGAPMFRGPYGFTPPTSKPTN